MKKIILLLTITLCAFFIAGCCSSSPSAVTTPAVSDSAGITAAAAPAVSDAPHGTNGPVETAAPNTTDVPQIPVTPQPTDIPQVTDAPKATDAPQATDIPQVTDIPQATVVPEVTPVPGISQDISMKISSMTLEEKIGQLIIVAARKWTDASGHSENSYVLSEEQLGALRDMNLCGICLFAQNISGTEQTVRLTDSIQKAVSESSSGIPAFIAVDQEGGNVTRLATGTSGMGNMAIGVSGKTQYAYDSAEIISSELAALGINVDFAPVSDVNTNPNNPVIGIRSFSDDANIVSANVGRFIEGLNANNIASCLKHFPGHGDTDTDSHTGLPCVNKSYEEINSLELIPFRENAANADFIMTAHIQFPQIEDKTYISTSTGKEVCIPATMSRKIITGILREDIGFDGVVITDALEMAAIRNNFALNDAVREIINVDVDIILMPYDLTSKSTIAKLKKLIDDIANMVRTGEISEEEIDNSVARVLALKEKKGLFSASSQPLTERIDFALSVVGCKEHHDKEWEMAVDAVQIIKSDIELPLSMLDAANGIILYEDNDQSIYLANQKLILDGTFPEAGVFGGVGHYGENYDAGFGPGSQFDDGFSCVIIVTSTRTLKDADITNPANKDLTTIKNIIAECHESGAKVIIISTYLPYDTDVFSDADVILACYNPASVESFPNEYDMENAYNGETKKYGPNVAAAIYKLWK